MPSPFAVIFEEFEQELAAVGALVQASADPKLARPRVRVAGANAAILLLAATFEEFVREIARSFARAVVQASGSYEKLPPRLASVAWRRTMEALARIRLDPRRDIFSRESIFADALTRFAVTYDFCRGDISQDIYGDLIYNENNMRPQEINSLFSVSGLGNVCFRACADDQLMNLLGASEQGIAHTQFVDLLEEFFQRRNQVAHSINAMRSSGPEQISKDIELLRVFGIALCRTLENQVEQ
jgi:hypothetical protein